MLMLYSIPFLTAIALSQAQLGIVGGTPLFDNSTCVTGPNTTFINCNTFYSALANCTSNTTEAVIVTCECKQSFFNLIVDCKSELRVCTGNNTWDATLDPQIDSWHSVCDSSAAKPTTPLLSAMSSEPTAKTFVPAGSGSTIAVVATSTGASSGKSSGTAASTATSGACKRRAMRVLGLISLTTCISGLIILEAL